MKTIKASEFKAKCLKLMDEVAETGEILVITKNGTPVSQLTPYRPPASTLFGLHGDRIQMADELIEPVGEEWEAAH